MSSRPATQIAGLPGLLVLFLVLALLAPASFAQEPAQEPTAAAAPAPSDSYKKTLASLLELIGAKVAGEQIAYAVAQETLGAIAATGTEITEQVQQIVVDEAFGEFAPAFGDIEYLTELYAPLYAEHLSEKELGELLAFYESPLGQKVLVALPSVAQTGAMALQQASLERLPDFQLKVDKKLRDIGVIVGP